MAQGRVGRVFDSFLRIMGVLFCIYLLIYLLITASIWGWPYAQALAWHVKLSTVDFELGRKVIPGNK